MSRRRKCHGRTGISSESTSESIFRMNTCCVCSATQLPSTERRRVIQPSKSVPTFTDLGRKLNEISQISQKLPRSAIVVVCRQCSDLVAKVEHLEMKLNDARSKIVHLVDEHARVSGSRQLSKRPMSPSFRGIGVSPAGKKSAPKAASSFSRQLFPPTCETLQYTGQPTHPAVPLNPSPMSAVFDQKASSRPSQVPIPSHSTHQLLPAAKAVLQRVVENTHPGVPLDHSTTSAVPHLQTSSKPSQNPILSHSTHRLLPTTTEVIQHVAESASTSPAVPMDPSPMGAVSDQQASSRLSRIPIPSHSTHQLLPAANKAVLQRVVENTHPGVPLDHSTTSAVPHRQTSSKPSRIPVLSHSTYRLLPTTTEVIQHVAKSTSTPPAVPMDCSTTRASSAGFLKTITTIHSI